MAEINLLHRLTLAAEGQALFAALSEAIPGLSRHQARRAVMAGLVRLDGAVARNPTAVLGARARAEVDLRQGISSAFHARQHHEPGPTERPFTILHQDRALVVVDKAAGVLSAPSARGERGHVPELLRRALSRRDQDPRYIGVVHRLDKETSGCLVLALTRTAQTALSAQFASHEARRSYRCLVLGGPRQDEDTLSGEISHGRYGRRVLLQGEDAEEQPGKEAVTRFRVLARHPGASELEVELETGRTHQIRVSLAAIGCPVIGDRVYGFRGPDRRPGAQTPLPRAPRLMLHAHQLEFAHPVSGDRLALTAPMPPVFAEWTARLGKGARRP